jgi:hypothetical protein
MEVVDEPFRGRRDGSFLPDHHRDLAIALEKNTAAIPQAGRQEATGLALGQDRPARDAFRELFEPFGAEELGPDGVLGFTGEGRRGVGRPEALGAKDDSHSIKCIMI